MNPGNTEGAARWTTVLWLAVGSLLIFVLAARLVGLRHGGDELPTIGRVPEFTLIDQTSQSFSSEDLEGRVWLASFIYTTCPGPCPLIVQRLGEIDRRLSRDPRFKIVSFSVDPEADSPEVLAVYGKTHNIDPLRWRLLTGSTDDVYALIRGAFLLAVERAREAGTGDTQPSEGAVAHSTRLALIDGRSRIRGYYDSEDALALRRVVEDVRQLIREEAR